MTYRLIFSAAFIFLATLSCQKKNEPIKVEIGNEILGVVDPEGGGSGPCPQGTHPVLEYEFDGVNFHRPRTQCASGFSFCIKKGKWKVVCVPDNPIAYIDVANNKTYVWSQVVGNQLEFHFPIALISQSGYSPSDFAHFNIEELWTIYSETNGSITLSLGQYTVSTTSTELIVLVNVQ